eukprot:6345042-Amphidinium_carterae.1
MPLEKLRATLLTAKRMLIGQKFVSEEVAMSAAQRAADLHASVVIGCVTSAGVATPAGMLHEGLLPQMPVGHVNTAAHHAVEHTLIRPPFINSASAVTAPFIDAKMLLMLLDRKQPGHVIVTPPHGLTTLFVSSGDGILSDSHLIYGATRSAIEGMVFQETGMANFLLEAVTSGSDTQLLAALNTVQNPEIRAILDQQCSRLRQGGSKFAR